MFRRKLHSAFRRLAQPDLPEVEVAIFVPTRAQEKGDCVHLGMNHNTNTVTATKTSNQMLKLAKRPPSASTVPRSVMKQAARIILPIDVSLRPPSIITA